MLMLGRGMMPTGREPGSGSSGSSAGVLALERDGLLGTNGTFRLALSFGIDSDDGEVNCQSPAPPNLLCPLGALATSLV